MKMKTNMKMCRWDEWVNEAWARRKSTSTDDADEWVFVFPWVRSATLNFPIYVLEWRRQLHSSNQWWRSPGTTWNHFKTNVKNNSKCFSIADGYLIVNTLASSQAAGRGVLCLCLTDLRRQLSRWADGNIESWTGDALAEECMNAGAQASIQWQSRVSALTTLVAFVFVTEKGRHVERVTSGKSQQDAPFPSLFLALPDWPTYAHTL